MDIRHNLLWIEHLFRVYFFQIGGMVPLGVRREGRVVESVTQLPPVPQRSRNGVPTRFLCDLVRKPRAVDPRVGVRAEEGGA